MCIGNTQRLRNIVLKIDENDRRALFADRGGVGRGPSERQQACEKKERKRAHAPQTAASRGVEHEVRCPDLDGSEGIQPDSAHPARERGKNAPSGTSLYCVGHCGPDIVP
ncbi:hypothetical protein [Aerolutibacter daejeonensis]|uniref:hypothetical protein n=1 Tax=Aerolutibacter daejeonensis TaxID=346181 RepID=UPI0018DC879A|nr:hypothetical protein [Lysobacter daejeonensis]